jgi:hypothetical protein
MFSAAALLDPEVIQMMRMKLFLVTAAAALLAAGAASADNGTAKMHYWFLGKLTATPANGAVSITVEGGSKAALRAMLGQPVTQSFAYRDNTEFLLWNEGIPTVVTAGNLTAGDYVRVNVRAPRGATLAEIEQVQAGIIGDHGTTLFKPTQPLYLFRGRLTATGSASVTIDVTGGDRRALRLLIGQSSSQTFTVGGETIFLVWQGKVPRVIDLAHLTIGDRIVVRIRADRGSTLAQIQAKAATKVTEREPKA